MVGLQQEEKGPRGPMSNVEHCTNETGETALLGHSQPIYNNEEERTLERQTEKIESSGTMNRGILEYWS